MIHVQELEPFLVESGVDESTAATMRKLVDVHGDFELHVNGVITYKVRATPTDDVDAGFDVYVHNAVA
jgi:hypothetical protein